MLSRSEKPDELLYLVYDSTGQLIGLPTSSWGAAYQRANLSVRRKVDASVAIYSISDGPPTLERVVKWRISKLKQAIAAA